MKYLDRHSLWATRYIADDDDVNWTFNKSSRIKFKSNSINDSDASLVSATVTATMPEKFKTKLSQLKVKILLHQSLVFFKSGLYVDREVKNASSILDSLLGELVEDGYLIEVKKGIVGKYKKPNVFVKGEPNENHSIPEFIHRLCKFRDHRLTYDNYIMTCKKINLHAK